MTLRGVFARRLVLGYLCPSGALRAVADLLCRAGNVRGRDGRRFGCLPKEAMDVKKLLALAAVAGGVLFVVRRNKSAKAQDDLWREATAPAAATTAKKA